MNNWGLEGVKTLGCPLSWTRLTECDEHNVKWLNQSLRTDFKVAAKAETFYVQISLKCRRIYDLGCYLTRLPCKGEQKVSCVLCLGCGRQRFTLKPFITICLMFLVIKQTVNTYSRWELSHFTVEQTSSPSCGGVCCPFGPGVPPGPYCRSVWNVKSSPSLEVRKRSLLDCIMLIGLWQSRGGGGNRFCCVYFRWPSCEMQHCWGGSSCWPITEDSCNVQTQRLVFLRSLLLNLLLTSFSAWKTWALLAQLMNCFLLPVPRVLLARYASG